MDLRLAEIFEEFESVKLVCLFGSRATGEAGPLSDYDFAVYLDERDPVRMTEIQLRLLDRLTRALQSDQLDVVVLNRVESPEMKYDIISQGILLFEREPFKVLVEPEILTEYFDFRESLRRHGLTRA